jgi:hypothetical protein
MKIVLAEVFSKSTVQSVPGVTVKPERRGVNFAPSGGMPVIFT